MNDLARALWNAECSQTPLVPISESHPGLGVAQAYEIQRAVRAIALEAGRRVVGRKVGLTSAAMQQMLGVEQPDYGCLFDSMVVDSGAVIELDRLIEPRAEAETAFLLDRPLAGAGTTAADVLAATRAVMPALEIIDSRIADWRITIVDTVADNASFGMAVLGDPVPLHGLELGDVEMTLTVGGEVVSGRGDAVLGHPAEAVAWLVNELHPHGEGLEAGDIVLPGALARALPIGRGEVARAEFSGLGAVHATFV